MLRAPASSGCTTWWTGPADDLHAVQTAMERAYSAEERRARGDAGAATEPLKIQRILRDAIGRVTLNACQS